MTAPASAAFLAETHERFLKAVVARLPIERIIELHLFPSIKQGGIESGVAVFAAVPEGERVTPRANDAVAEPVAAADEADAPLPEMPLDALVSSEDACIPPLRESEAAADATPDTAPDAPHPTPHAPHPSPDVAMIDDGDAERLEEAVHAVTEDFEDPAAQAMAAASLELADLPANDERPHRYTIYSARYRLVLKGPDRGKWEVSVTAEADAPLVTVESVVRGVQRRSGDTEEMARWTGEELRAALRLG
jgi:hypothetical protein